MEETALQKLNRIVGNMMADVSPRTRSLRFRYWQFDKPRKHELYSYTTERDNKNHFHACIYRRNSAGQYRLIKSVPFRQCWKAKERAYYYYRRAKGEKPTRAPVFHTKESTSGLSGN